MGIGTLSGEGNKRYAKWPSLGSVASAGGASPVALRPGAFACATYVSANTWALVSALRAVVLVSSLRLVITKKLCVEAP